MKFQLIKQLSSVKIPSSVKMTEDGIFTGNYLSINQNLSIQYRLVTACLIASDRNKICFAKVCME